MKYTISTYAIWEYGQRKDDSGNPHQEDSMFPAYGEAKAEDRLFLVCDGMGGHDKGEVASATVCEAMSAAILAKCPGDEEPFTVDMVKEAIAAAYNALDSKDTDVSNIKRMGTTMTMLKLHSAGATIAHIGDSRVYHIRPGKTAKTTQILHKTYDHSLVNDLVKIGEMTPEEARNSPRKNVLTRAMQPHLESRCIGDIYETADVRPGDIFYMCSDGMLEEMDDEQLCYIFSDESPRLATMESKVNLLRADTENNRDNHTAYIIRIESVKEDAIPTKIPTLSARVNRSLAKIAPRRRVNRQQEPEPNYLWLLICVAAVAFIVALLILM